MVFGFPRRRGVSLVEGVLYTVIALGVVAGGIVYFQKSQVASQTTATARDAVGLSAQVRGLYERQDSFAGLDAATVISAGIVPAASLDEAGTGILSAFGTPVEIAPEDAKGTDDIFVVHLRDLDRAPCTRLGTVSLDGTGPMGTGIVAMGITPEDGEMVAGQLGEGLSPSQAAEACGAVGNTITAAYAPGMDAAFGTMDVAGLEAGPPEGFYYFGNKEDPIPIGSTFVTHEGTEYFVGADQEFDSNAGKVVSEGTFWSAAGGREISKGNVWHAATGTEMEAPEEGKYIDDAGRYITDNYHYSSGYGGEVRNGWTYSSRAGRPVASGYPKTSTSSYCTGTKRRVYGTHVFPDGSTYRFLRNTTCDNGRWVYNTSYNYGPRYPG